MLLNKKRAKEYMIKHGLVAIVAASPVNVSYLTGLDCWMYRSFKEYMWVPGGSQNLKQAFAILPLEGKPALILDQFTLPFAQNLEVEKMTYGQQPNASRKGQSGSLDHRDSPASVLANTMSNLGLNHGKVGIELEYMPLATRRILRRRLPGLLFKDAPELFRFIRMSKTEGEILKLKLAAETNERALRGALESAKSGSEMGMLRRAFVAEVAKEDAQLEHFIYSPHGIGITNLDGYRLRNGDVTYVDTGCIYKMYCSDTGVTLAIGRMETETAETQKKLWESTERMFDWLRPGIGSSEVFRKLANEIRGAGIENCHYEGHGIGLEVREHPIISKSSHGWIADSVVDESVNLPLEKGMVVNIEVPITDYGKRSMQVERTFLIGQRRTTEIGGSSKEIPYLAST